MFVALFRWIFGYVTFEVVGKFSERFINIVTKNGLNIWNTKKCGGVLYAQMYIKDYKHIRPFCKKSKVRLKVHNRHGLPFLIKKYKSRVGVAVGALVFILVVCVLSSYVWTIDVTGLKTISHSELMKVLKENGLYVGTYKNNASFQTIARDTMIDIDGIGWMAINVTGSHASVEIKEKAVSPDVENLKVPANIKAKCDGLIKSIDVKSGESYFKAGSAVVKDQLIVSAVVEDKLGGVRLVRAQADVIAQTVHKKRIIIEKQKTVHSFADMQERKYVNILGASFPVSIVFSDDRVCASRYSQHSVCVNDINLPLSISEQRLYTAKKQTVKISEKKAQQAINAQSLLYRCFVLSDAEVTDINLKFSDENDAYACDITYTCCENIAYQQEIDAKQLKITTPAPTQEQKE